MKLLSILMFAGSLFVGHAAHATASCKDANGNNTWTRQEGALVSKSKSKPQPQESTDIAPTTGKR